MIRKTAADSKALSKSISKEAVMRINFFKAASVW